MFKQANRLFRRFLDLSSADRVFLFRAAVELWCVRRRLKATGLRNFRQLSLIPDGLVPENFAIDFGERPVEIAGASARAVSPAVMDPAVADQAAAACQRTARLVQAARHLLPGRCTCLELALAGQRLLAAQRIASDVRIGVRKIENEFEAHAWLESLGAVVMGGTDVYERYSVMAPLGLAVSGVKRG